MTPSETIEMLVIAIDEIEAGKDFTQEGLPQVEALEAKSGIKNITAAERDEAWKVYQHRVAEAAEAAKNKGDDKSNPPAEEGHGNDGGGEGNNGKEKELTDEEKATAEKNRAEHQKEAEETAKAVKEKKETEAKAAAEAEAAKKGIFVAEGKAFTSLKGILGPGARVEPEYFSGDGKQIVKDLLDSGALVKID